MSIRIAGIWILIIWTLGTLAGCSNSMTKLLKNPDPAYKLRMAEQFFAKEQYIKAQQVYEDVMPYYKASKEFEDIYYKYAYCAYNLRDFMNAENLFKSYLEIFPNSSKAEEVDYMRAYSFYKQSPRAVGVAFTTLLNNYPDSDRGDLYKLMIIRSYYRYAEMSVEEKKVERFEQVITECYEFVDRFPDSKLRKDVDEFLNNSKNNIKNLTNE